MDRQSIETFIIGAGPTGLAVAHCLSQAGLPYLQVDQADAVGATWRGHYDRLHLHTTKQHSALPGLPFPEHYPQYPSRDQVVAYLERYAEHFGLTPRLGERVERATCHEGAWRIDTTKGRYLADNLVVASGYNAVPKIPRWPGDDAFAGRVLHSAEYRTGAAFAGQRAVVVGCGNSGAEIALDLWEQGAAAVTMIVRGPRYVVPRDVLGVPAQVASLIYARLPRRLADALARRAARLASGDLSAYGFREPEAGPLTEVDLHGRVALIDVGTVDLIKQGKIQTAPGIERFEPEAVICEGGLRVAADVVVLATGYRAHVEEFLEGAAELVDYRGYPSFHARACPLPGLYFAGFRNPATGFLRESGIEARRLAELIGAAR